MMRKTMNLKSLMEGSPVTLGDEVKVGREDEEKRDGIVKVPHGPGNTTGVLIDGELEMAPKNEIQRERTDERTDMERARRAMDDAKGTDQHKALRDRFEKMKERERTDEGGSDPFHDGAVACSKGEPISANRYEPDTDEFDRWESGWRAEASHERAAKRADYADDFGDEAADDYMREDEEDDAIGNHEPAEEADDVLEESFVLGMTMMPSLERMQQLAGIRTEAAEVPAFLKKDDEDDAEDDQAEETETDQTVEAEPEAETDQAAEEGEAEQVEDNEADDADADDGEDEVEVVVAADEEPSDDLVDAAQAFTAQVEDQPTDELAPNHPSTAGEVTMMSVPTTPVEPEPQPEPEPAADPVDVCMKALAELEGQLPNVSVKDFANINKRLTAIQSSLFEGQTGRRRKAAVTEARRERNDIDSYSIELKDSPMGEKYAVYGWGVYPRSSVLAGQTMKCFLDWFDTEAEARAAYPEAEGDTNFRSAHNTYSHLPGEDDPVPGGMYRDDI